MGLPAQLFVQLTILAIIYFLLEYVSHHPNISKHLDLGSWNLLDLAEDREGFKQGTNPKVIIFPNYNLLLSIHHPSFFAEYKRIVLPLFGNNVPAVVQTYLKLHS